MKKRLEADLISIAHRILQIKDKSDTDQLYLETQKLYEKLSVLRFVEKNYGQTLPTIGNYSEIEKEIEGFFDLTPLHQSDETAAAVNIEQIAVTEEVSSETATSELNEDSQEKIEEETVISEDFNEVDANIELPTEENQEEQVLDQEPNPITEESAIENEETQPLEPFEPAFELAAEPEIEDQNKKDATVQISFEDLLGLNYNEPQFIKVEDAAKDNSDQVAASEVKSEILTEEPVNTLENHIEKEAANSISLNDKFSKGIEIDLNDRLAFVKHLFGNSNEDYNRVMNQLITYDNFYETKSFIDEMVKPDYDNWEGKEEYEERFMDIIEKKFL